MEKYTPLSKERANLRAKWNKQTEEPDWEKYVEKAEQDYLRSQK